jgi:hypothetical protein
MEPHTFSDKQKRSSKTESYSQYLIIPSEPKEVTAAARGSFSFRNRYLAKRRVLRTIRQLRRGHV